MLINDKELKAMNDMMPATQTMTTAPLSVPTTKHEEWKHTPVNRYYDASMPILDGTDIDTELLQRILNDHYKDVQAHTKGEQKGAYRLIIVNGKVDMAQSVLPTVDTIVIKPIAQCTESERAAMLDIVQTEGNYFATKNVTSYHDGIYLSIAAGIHLERPLHIIHTHIHDTPMQSYSRIWLHAQAGSQLDIIETYAGAEGKRIFVNAIVEILLDKGAFVHHYDIQKAYAGYRQVKRTEARQLRDSEYNNYTINTPGGDFYRNNLAIHLDTEGLSCHLYGLYLTDKQQLVDNHTEVHHKKPHGESNQLYKGLLLDESRAVFNGKIFVYPDAQKTNAFQQSQNILFSDEATINAKPQLEIFADDVKCSHGTTIGQLDPDAMFYLKSRGITEVNARKMLANAFAYDVAEKIKNPAVRLYVEEQIHAAMD